MYGCMYQQSRNSLNGVTNYKAGEMWTGVVFRSVHDHVLRFGVLANATGHCGYVALMIHAFYCNSQEH